MSNFKKDTIDDVSDDLFISKKPQNYIFAEKKINDINEKTSKMLFNSRVLIEESERIGQSSLEQLSSQRETLDRVENDLDNINSMTRSTQKHLNNMKSFFGGIKSIFSNSNSSTSNQPNVPGTRAGLPRSATVASMPMNAGTNQSEPKPSSFKQETLPFRVPDKPAEDEFGASLGELGFGLGRLKELAMKLGDEIGDQNEVLTRITEKSERAGDSINHQNRQMQQLLRKG